MRSAERSDSTVTHISPRVWLRKSLLDIVTKADTLLNWVADMNHDYDSIDEAYAMFARTGTEYGGGLANHGPMAAEALAAMHRPNAISDWAHRYLKRLEPHPSATSRIFEAEWREALGKENRVADWIAFFDEALKEAPWRVVL